MADVRLETAIANADGRPLPQRPVPVHHGVGLILAVAALGLILLLASLSDLDLVAR